MKFIIVLLISSTVFYSCKNDAQDPETNTKDNVIDTVKPIPNTLEIDTIQPQEKVCIDTTPEKSSQEIIEQKFGKQWDFCDCIKANDSINTAMAGENLSDKDFDFLVDRLDEIAQKCKEILIVPNTTVEEREAHKAKVKKCLN